MAIAKDKLFGFSAYVPWGRIIIGVELMAAFSYFGLAALMLLSARVFFRAEITYAQLLSFYGVQAIWSTAYLLVESFLLMIGTEGSIMLCLFVFWISILHTFLIGIFSYGEVVHLSPDKKAYKFPSQYTPVDVLTDTTNDNPDKLFRILFCVCDFIHYYICNYSCNFGRRSKG